MDKTRAKHIKTIGGVDHLTVNGLANWLGQSRKSVDDMINEGLILPSVMVNCRMFFHEDDVKCQIEAEGAKRNGGGK